MKKIIIVDFGGQYTHLIARMIKNLYNCFTIITDLSNLNINSHIAGVILSGSPKTAKLTPTFIQLLNTCNNLHIPVLGICYGLQLLAVCYGATIKHTTPDYGCCDIDIHVNHALFKNIQHSRIKVWMSHGDSISWDDNDDTADTDDDTDCEHSMIRDGNKIKIIGTTGEHNIPCAIQIGECLYGIQFHPEVYHTVQGKQIFINFLTNICNLQLTIHNSSMIDDILNYINHIYDGKSEVLLGARYI